MTEPIRTGQVRGLVIATPERSPMIPDVPTSAEAGFPGLLTGNWWALAAPRGTGSTRMPSAASRAYSTAQPGSSTSTASPARAHWRAWRTASAIESASSKGTPVFSSLTASLPSTMINPEKSITYEIGARVHTEKLKGSLTGYLTKLSDLITSTTSGTVVIGGTTYNATRNSNSAQGYITGVEFALSYDLDRHFTIFNNTTWTYGQNQSQNVPLRFIPPLYGNFGVRFESDEKRYWVELAELWAGPLIRHNPSDEIDAGFSTDPAYGSPSATNPPINQNFQIPGFFVTNIRTGWKVWEEGNRSFSLTVNLNNVFDTKYRQAYSQQQRQAAGFNVVVGGRLTF